MKTFNILNIEDLKKLRCSYKDRIIFKCVKCGKTVNICYGSARKRLKLLCPKCKTEETLAENYPDDPTRGRFGSKKHEKIMIEKYNDKNYNNREKAKETCLNKSNGKYINGAQYLETIEKMQKTNRLNHNGKLFVQTEEFKEKCKNKNQITKGVDWPTQSDKVKDRSKKTCLNKYGVEYSFQSKNNKEKSKITLIEKYGVDNAFKSEIIKNKIKNNNLQKYGVEYYTQTEDMKNKSKSTCLKKYGVENYGQTEYAQHNRKPTYIYKNIHFDSQPELSFYLEYEKEGIIRNYDEKFPYKFKNNISYVYPDFKFKNNYIEIKGEQFLDKETGRWINPFRRPEWTDEEYQDACDKMEEKRKCLIENNVQIIYTYEILDIIKKWKKETKKYKVNKMGR